jgi:hypothetical protein
MFKNITDQLQSDDQTALLSQIGIKQAPWLSCSTRWLHGHLFIGQHQRLLFVVLFIGIRIFWQNFTNFIIIDRFVISKTLYNQSWGTVLFIFQLSNLIYYTINTPSGLCRFLDYKSEENICIWDNTNGTWHQSAWLWLESALAVQRNSFTPLTFTHFKAFRYI